MAHFHEALFKDLNDPYCSRCSGLMVDEQVFGSMEFYWARRCNHCGEMIDTLIIQNRNVKGLTGSPAKWTCRVS